MDEVWRTIQGTDGYYEISNLGRVRSLPRVVTLKHYRQGTCQRSCPGRMLTPLKLANGYWAIGMLRKKKYIHRLIMEEFGPPMPFPDAIVRHRDDNKDNNTLDNLVWGTQSDNFADAVRNDRMTASMGENHYLAKLSYEKAAYIREAINAGVSMGTLARKFGVHTGTIFQVKWGMTWMKDKYTQSVDQEKLAGAAIVRLQTGRVK